MDDRVMPDKRPAPVLMVIFMCPICRVEFSLDAYRGVPTCNTGHKPEFMDGLRLDSRGSNPLGDIEAMRSTERRYA